MDIEEPNHLTLEARIQALIDYGVNKPLTIFNNVKKFHKVSERTVVWQNMPLSMVDSCIDSMQNRLVIMYLSQRKNNQILIIYYNITFFVGFIFIIYVLQKLGC
ncbi:hypothetical protein ABPG72_005914 [Tetrahymena utriculariae]